MAVSHIMLEAYKKYILVSLILHGKVQPLPKYTSQIVGRFIKVRTNHHYCVDVPEVCAVTNLFSSTLSACLFFLLPTAPEQRVPRASSGLHHQQPSGVAQLGQQTQWDLHTRQQHRPGQTVPLVPVQEEHPEVNEGRQLEMF